MKKRITFLMAAFTLLAFLAIPMGMNAQSDYSTDYTGNITLSTTGGTNASTCKVTINDTPYDGIKAGTGSIAGAMKMTVPSGTKYLHIHAAAWNQKPCSLAITPAGYSSDIALTANSGIANNSPFTFNGDPSTSDYYKVITFTNALTADTELTFTATGNTRFVIWGVTSEEAGATPTVSKPTITPNGGSFVDSQEISISCTTDGATIYYTTNGNDPTTSSTQYTAPFTLTATTTVKAFAVKSGMENSAIATAEFTKASAMTVADAIAALNENSTITDAFVSGVVSQVDEVSTQHGNATYWISDDGTTTSQLEVYRGKYLNNANFTSADQIQVGDEVVVYGTLTYYNNTTYEFATGNYLISLNRPTPSVATPTFNPAAGTYTEAQTVTIDCATASAVIYYTLDGTEPTNASTPYLAEINIDATTTIKAIAYVDTNHSAVASATYTINLPAPTLTFNKIDGHNPVEGQVYLIVDLNSGKALTSANGTSSAPTAVEVTITNDQITTNNTDLQWTLEAVDGGYVIRSVADNTKWLYSTDANNGVRVGTNEASAWTLDITDDSNPNYHGFKHNGTSRYLGVYNSQDWRAYGSVNNNIKDTQIALFVNGEAPAPAPSFTIENNNEIAYDATSGSFNFTINNAVEGGATTVSEDVEWISNPAVSGNTVSFTTTANEAGTTREGVITLTYTYNRSTVTKNVTVTQAGNPVALMTIAEVRTQATGDVATKGIVTSFSVNNNSNKTTAYIQDATAAVVVFGEFSVAVGDEIRVSGTLSEYNGLLEIINPTIAVNSQGNTIQPELMTIAQATASTNQAWYIRIEEAKVTAVNNQNVTITQSDNNIVVRFVSSDDINFIVNDVISFNGNIGYYNNTNQIAHPQNITVQQNTEPTITIATNTINAPVEGTSGTVNVTYQNITELYPEVDFCDAEGNPATYSWFTAEIDEDNNVAYTVEANQGEARVAYFRVYATDDEGEDVFSEKVTVNQEAHVAPTFAELPFEFNYGRDSIAETDGLYQDGLGTDYANVENTKLKFDGTGDWLLLQFNERPGKLTFDIKNNSFSGGTFTVQTSEDGVNYTDLKNYTEITGTQNEEFNNLGENVRYIKWIYTQKASGNVGLGNIILLPYTEPQEYTLTIGNPDNVTITVGYGTDGVLTNDESASILEGTEISLVAVVTEGYEFEGFAVTDADGNEITLTENNGVYSFFMPSSNVTVNASAAVAPVVTTTTYTMATTIESGKTYIIVGWADNVAYAMGEQRTNNRGAVEISISDNVATVNSSAGVYEFVIEGNRTDGYTIFDDVNQGYLYAASSSANHLKTQEENNADGIWTITFVEGGSANVIASQSENRNVMQFNNGSKIFSCYSSASQHPVYFYVKDETPSTVTQTVTLTSGWNWFSTYIAGEPTNLLQMLETSLGENGTVIKSKTISTDYYEDYGWYGDLDDEGLMSDQMYMIETSAACTVELEGMPINTAEVEITINHGWNWIGFPSAEPMNVVDAFAGFEAADGDILKNKAISTDYYEDFGWYGELETMEPGQGFMYYSNSQETKTLVFGSTSKAKHNAKPFKK